MTLVVGEEELLAERAVARLVAAAGPADNVRHVRAAELRPGELATLAAPSLFGDGCVLVLHGTEDAVKAVADEITAIAADPPPDTVLVLTHAGGAKGKALLTALGKQRVPTVDCPKITRMGERMRVRPRRVPHGRPDRRGQRGARPARRARQRPARAGRRELSAGRGHHRGDRPDGGGPVLPGPGRGQRVQRGRPGRRGAAGRGPGDAPLGAGHRRVPGADHQRPGPGGPAARPGRQRRPRASPTRRWPPRSAPRPGRWTGSASSFAAGPRKASPAPCPRSPRPTRRSRAKAPARPTPWRSPSDRSSPAGPAADKIRRSRPV